MMVVSQIYKFPREDIMIIMISNDNSQYVPKTNTILYEATQAWGHGGCTNDLLA